MQNWGQTTWMVLENKHCADFKSLVSHCNFKSQQRAIPLHLYIQPKLGAFPLMPPLSDPGLGSPCFQKHPWYTAWHQSIYALYCSLVTSYRLVFVPAAGLHSLWGQDLLSEPSQGAYWLHWCDGRWKACWMPFVFFRVLTCILAEKFPRSFAQQNITESLFGIDSISGNAFLSQNY